MVAEMDILIIHQMQIKPGAQVAEVRHMLPISSFH